MVSSLSLVLSLAAALPGQASPPGVITERIFGPEKPGKYKHPAAITQLLNGDFYLVFHGGTGEYADDTAVWGARQTAGSAGWEDPHPVADTPFHGDGNAVIWQAPDGVVWLFYVVRYGPTWADSRIKAKVSRDGARTWSDSFVLAFEAGMMVRGAPIVLPGGDYLLPAYHEVGNDPESVSKDCTSLFLRRDARSGVWSETPRVRSRLGNIQPAPAMIDGSYLVFYARRGGTYEPTTDGWLVRSESRDGGKTWSEGKDSSFPNPNAAVDFLRLRNGHLLLVYNDSMNERTPLTVAISTDGDKSYPFKLRIADGPGDYGYPFAIQAADGKIHIVYTSDERTVVRRAIFEESAVLAGPRKP